MGGSVVEAQLTINSITPSAVTNTPGTVATYNVNYSWPNLTLAATGAVMTITVPDPVQNSAAGNIVLVNNPQITNSFYTPATKTITFQFISPLPAGSAGTVQFQAYMRTDGTVTNAASATFQATFSSVGQASATGSASLTASGVTDDATLSKSILGKGTVTTNSLITYQLSPRNANPSLNITNWTMVDTLPPRVVYVSSSAGGVYSPAAGTVTWTSNSTPFNVGYAPNFLVQVYAPSSAFAVGSSLTNRVTTTSIFLDGATVVKSATNTISITAPSVSFDAVAKTSSGWNGLFNSPFTWATAWRARGNDNATTLTVTDPLPPAFVLTAINPGFCDINPTVVYIQYQTKNNPSWTSLPGSPFTTTNGTDANNKTYYLTNLHLVSDLVSAVQWTYTNVTPLFAFNSGDVKPTLTGSITNVDRNGNAVSSTASITNYASLGATYYGTNVPVGTTSNSVTLAVAAPLVAVVKSTSAGNPGQPGQTNTWTLQVSNGGTASDNLTNPVTADLLPLSLQYVPGSATGAGGNLTLTNTTVTTNYNGTGRTLLRLQYSGYLKPGNSASTTIKTYINSGVAPSTVTNAFSLIGWGNATANSSSPWVADTNNLSGTGNTNTLFPTTSGNLTVTAAAAANSVKQIKGQLDSGYMGYPQYGSSYPGGPFSYQETVSNPGNITLTNITVVDILPFVGDVGVLVTNQARGSAWQPFLTGPVSGPSGVTVYYSTSTNPYRPEILGTNTPGAASDWTTVLPADVTTVRALKFAFGPTNVLKPLDAVQLTWTLQIPVSAATNSFAYNSFAYTATPAMTNTTPLISEPNKVGILALPTQPAFLGDYVWNDVNDDGLQNNGETGINNVRVELYAAGPSKTPGAADNTLLQFVLTSAGPTGSPGYYQFPYLAPSNYFVKIIPPANYVISPQYQGSSTNLDSNLNPTTGWSDLLTLTAGTTNESVDGGLHYTGNGSVGDYVWIDRNGDGIQNEGSIDGLNGVTVQIYSVTGTATNLYATTTSGFDSFGNPGYYHFYNLPPSQYQLRFVPPAGDTFTTREANGANSGNGSEANSAGWTSVFTVSAGQVNNTWDAGIVLPSGPLSVGNLVWYDPNADSRYDFFGGERGINNVVVSLYYDTDSSGVFTPGTDQLFSSTLTATVSGEPGNYAFNNLPAGNFIVVLEAINFQPGGVLYGLTNDPAWVPDSPGYLDNINKGEPVGPYVASTAFTLAAGTEPTTPNSNMTLDFGLTYLTNLCSVGSAVFLDSNQNGKQDAGEGGVAGVGVQLWRLGPSSVVGGSDAALVASTTTDVSGNYLFTNLPPTNYFIEIPTPPTAARAVSPVVYPGNQKDGYNHGTQPGGYNTAVFGPSFILSPGTEPTDTIETAQGGTLDDSLPGGDANGDMTEDFGFFDSTSLVAMGNTIFNDLNANGKQDAGEPGIAGVGLALAHIVNGVSNVVAYTTSDSTGHYKFDLLAPGNYQVVVLATNFQAGGLLTNFLSSPGAVTGAPPDAYVDDHGIDGAAAAVNGIHSAVYDLEVGTAPSPGTNATAVEVPITNANLTIDFGFTPTCSLGNRVFADNGVGGGTMNNGLQDGTEPGISNVVVKLFAADGAGSPTGTALATNTTDVLGYYRFDGLVAGTYVVVVDSVASGTALGGLVSSTGWDTGLATADGQMDHGIDLALGASSVLPGGIPSVPVTLGTGLQPLGETDVDGATPNPPRGHGPAGDANDTLVLDFGFTPAYSVTKSLVAVSQPPAGASGAVVTSGGQVTYGLVVGLPEGSLSGLTVVDQVPAGMQYVSSQVVTAMLGSSNLLSANFAGTLPTPTVTGGTGNGTAVTWTFGAISVSGLVPTNLQYFVVLVTLQALDVPGNVGVGVQSVLANGASVVVPAQPAYQSSPVNVTVVEPVMGLAKTMAPTITDAEGLVTVTLVATNAGTSTAYAVNVQDILTAANFDLATVALGTSGVNYPASFTASYSAASGTVLYSGGTIAASGSATFAFTAKLAASVVPGSTVTNTAALTQATTLPGAGGRHEPGASATNTVAVYTRSVSGYVYAEANNNGTKDAGESGLAGVTVTLTGTDANGHAVNLSTNTAVDGSYLFPNLAPGTYTLTRTTTPSGYLDGKETAGSNFGGAVNNSAASTTIVSLTIPGGSSVSGANYNFGLVQPNSLAGLVFSDQNNDGLLNGADFGISNVVVVVTGTSDWGSVNLTNVTVADGTYAFPNLRPGVYTITETQPSAFGQGRNLLGTAGGANSATDVFSGITLTQAQNGTGYNFAEIPGAVAGTVFSDANYNQSLDFGEGLAGIPVILTGTNTLGQAVNLTNTTATAGAYGFSNLLAGCYTVQVQTNALAPGLIEDVDPDAVLDSATSFNLTGGQTTAGLNFGYYLPVIIGDYVWNDANANGVQESGETGLAGVAVTLSGTDGSGRAVNASTNTDAAGHYYFVAPPGTYTVSVATPVGFTPTLAGQGTPATDSNPSPSATTPAFLSSGGGDLTVDFGFYQPVIIGDWVWNDVNANGIQDAGETGLAGVTVNLTGTSGAGVTINAVTNTDASGHYYFAEPPGAYRVSVSTPPYYLPTLTGQGAAGTDSNPSPSPTTPPTLSSGGSDLTVDFGFKPTFSIGNKVFLDLDNDGNRDYAERGIAAVRMVLFAADGLSNPTGNALASTNTDAYGYYRFDGLLAGTYVVVVDQANSPNLTGLVTSTGATTDTTLGGDSEDHGTDIPVTVGGVINGIASTPVTVGPGLQPTGEIATDDAGEGANGPTGDLNDNLTVDFGFTPTYSLGNLVFADANNNGVKDGTDSGISGVRMALFAANGAGNPTGSALANTTTDANGYYRFDGLVTGTYVVVIDPAASPVLAHLTSSTGASTDTTLSGDLRDHGLDAPVNVGTIVGGFASTPITLGPGLQPSGEATGVGAGAHGPNGDASDNLVMSFGFTPTYSLGHRVFLDNGAGGGVANNGIQDGTEPGIASVVVKLFASDGPGNPTGAALATTTTDDNGYYRFDGLVTGSYVVVVDVNGSPSALAGLVSSAGYCTDLTLAGDLRDHGKDTPLGAGSVLPGGIAAVPVILGAGLQPTGEATGTGAGANGPAGDANDNLVLNFGFAPTYSIGHRVFADNGAGSTGGSGINDGMLDGTEPGIANVTVQLKSNGIVLATTNTDASGYYRFDYLPAGSYTVFLPPSNFNVGGSLSGMLGSRTVVAGDGGNKGLAGPTPAVNGITTDPVTVGPGLQPAGEAATAAGAGAHGPLGDAYDNLTVDLGLVPATGVCSLGSLVWHDANNNGVYDPRESGIPGVAIEVWSSDAAGNLLGNSPVGTTTTAGDGTYLVPSLTPGTYRVRIPAANFNLGEPLQVIHTSSTLVDTNDDHIDNDNNGIQSVVGGDLLSPVITLRAGGEPTDGSGLHDEFGPGATLDNGVNDANGDMTVDFGFYSPTTDQGDLCSLGSGVWKDLNNNGAWDSGEPGIAGVTLVLYQTNAAGLTYWTSTTTAADGTYFFHDLPSGSNWVIHIPATNFAGGAALAGCPITAGTPVNADNKVDNDNNGLQPGGVGTAVWSPVIHLVAGAEPIDGPTGEFGPGSAQDNTGNYVDANGDMTVDFGFTPTYSLGHRVFADLNNNGVMDGADAGIGGVQVKLFAADGASHPTGSALAVTQTDANGYYRFDNLVTGTYVVVVDKANSPSLAGYASSSGASTDTSLAGEGLDHGQDTAVSVGEVVNGIASGPVTLGPGRQPTGETTGPGAGANGPNGDVSDNLVIDFGFTPTYSIGNWVFWDPDNCGGGGADKLDEVGLPNVALVLFAADVAGEPTGSPLAATTTDANGFYRFDGIVKGTYVVVVDKLASPVLDGQVVDTVLFADTTRGGDLHNHGRSPALGTGSVLPGGIASVPLTVGPGLQPLGELTGPGAGADGPSGDASDNLVIDFGFTPTYSLGHRVFADTGAGGGTANDGIQNGAEPGIPNVVVKLFAADGAGNPTGSALQTTTTDAGGYYRFDGITYGTYVPVVDVAASAVLAGYASSAGASTDTTLAGSGHDHGQDTPVSVGGVVNGIAGAPVLLDVDAQPLGEVATVSGPGAHGPTGDANDNLTDDFGFTRPGSIAGGVFLDLNGNGQFDTEDTTGIGSVTVQLKDSTGAVVATAHSLPNGSFAFAQVMPGSYTLVETVPAGYAATTPVTLTVTVADGQSVIDENYLDMLPVTIGDYVWNDANANGIQDPQETGIPGVSVTLAGTSGANVAVNLSTNTDSTGHYVFTVWPGTYTVSAATPACFIPTLTRQGNAASDSNPNPSGTTPLWLTSGASDLTVDFGYYQPVTLGDYVWDDLNGDGVQNDGATGLTNVGLTLTGTSASGAAVTAFATTDAAGHYHFTEPPGNYTVSVDRTNFDAGAPLAGYVPTMTGRGTAGTGSAGSPASTLLAEGGSDLTLDFGYYKPVTIGDYVWNDANANGIQDAREVGLAGVTLTLTGTTVGGQSVTDHATTDPTGHYLFVEPPGTYTVRVDASNATGALLGYTATLTGKGTAVTDSNPNPSGTTPGTLSPGASDLTVDFGYYQESPTLALLKSIRAYPVNGTVVVAWQTASEVDTLAFDLYRQVQDGASGAKAVSWMLVNTDPVLATDSITGGQYSVVDTTAAIPGTYTYQLVEWDLDGSPSVVGVYQLAVSTQPQFIKVQPQNGQLLLEWQGGVAPYRLEHRRQLTGTEVWTEVLLRDPNATKWVVPLDAGSGFYRISNAQ